MIAAAQIRTLRTRLLAWYRRHHRQLPWRETRDPYRIWVSEVMLQQTRVAAVLLYYERFLNRFPTVEALGAAPQQDVLTHWAGLGYYSRARNLHAAAKQITAAGEFPRDFKSIRALPGIGDYTAAAIASIAFDLPHAVVDGNVLRVLTRLTNDPSDIRATTTRRRLAALAQRLLATRHPGEFNQAIMELGATICTPKQPSCDTCPLIRLCQARQHDTQHQLPIKLGRQQAIYIEKTLLIIQRRNQILLRQRPADAQKLAGFWELPDASEIPSAQALADHGSFRHSITNHNYRFTVLEARLARAPRGFEWVSRDRLTELPLSTTAKKALRNEGKVA